MASFNPQCITYSQMNLIFNARFYYRRLTTWTRAYLTSRYFDIGTLEAQFERLYLETLDIGEMMQIIFGRQASERYAQMVSQYAILFNQLISAQLEGNEDAVRENVQRLRENVDERALFLEAMNPYWTAEGYRDLFYSYIDYIIETANAIAARDLNRDIELYDILNEHTNRMGDVFAQGIYQYITSGTVDVIPEADTPCITEEQMEDIFTIRMFWLELVTWVRIYMLSRYAGAGDPNQAFERLMQVPVEYVNTVKKYFPHIDADGYLQLFTTYIELITSLITALIENDVEALNRITVSLYENADERAEFVASINPFWDAEQWRDILYVNLRSTIEEATSFLLKDYARNIDIFTRLLDQAETSSTLLAQGLFNYFVQNKQTTQ